ncbi:MAG: ATP-grasp domain-containing protein [Oscillospiraceae bacterium]|nr:ATP-grasp domain-containing protein [Oscillospiraceae bacterium]
MTVWLVYERAGAERNREYISMHIERGRICGVKFSLVLCDDGLPDGKPDFAVVRAMRPDISRELEARGIRCVNPARVSEICNNKARTYEFLHANGVPVIPWVSATQDDTPPVIDAFPMVIKPCCGHGGANVTLIRDEYEYEQARKKIEPDEYVIQPLATETGRDMRVYVLGGEPVAAVLRTSDGDFRSNFSLGGKVEARKLGAMELALVKKVCALLPFDYCGIDIMYHEGKPVINEIEDVVGSRMLYATHKNIDIVSMFIDYLIQLQQITKLHTSQQA